MAMACLRLFTRPPLPALPERSVPLFLLRIALATVLLASLLYLRREPDLLAAMGNLLQIRIVLGMKSLRLRCVAMCRGFRPFASKSRIPISHLFWPIDCIKEERSAGDEGHEKGRIYR